MICELQLDLMVMVMDMEIMEIMVMVMDMGFSKEIATEDWSGMIATKIVSGLMVDVNDM